ncbi:hypothetical protein HDU97_001877 [Phlyctochytrium planicorne]|nr:hypothetical protein HDU97_001877 [Phlyctochytrium planicorne]
MDDTEDETPIVRRTNLVYGIAPLVDGDEEDEVSESESGSEVSSEEDDATNGPNGPRVVGGTLDSRLEDGRDEQAPFTPPSQRRRSESFLAPNPESELNELEDPESNRGRAPENGSIGSRRSPSPRFGWNVVGKGAGDTWSASSELPYTSPNSIPVTAKPITHPSPLVPFSRLIPSASLSSPPHPSPPPPPPTARPMRTPSAETLTLYTALDASGAAEGFTAPKLTMYDGVEGMGALAEAIGRNGVFEGNVEFGKKYCVGDVLGRGATAVVLGGYRCKDAMEVAVKFILKDKIPPTAWKRDRFLGIIPIEAFILKRVSHRNIIQFLDVFEDNHFFYLVMEAAHSIQQHGEGEGGPPSPTAISLMETLNLARECAVWGDGRRGKEAGNGNVAAMARGRKGQLGIPELPGIAPKGFLPHNGADDRKQEEESKDSEQSESSMSCDESDGDWSSLNRASQEYNDSESANDDGKLHGETGDEMSELGRHHQRHRPRHPRSAPLSVIATSKPVSIATSSTSAASSPHHHAFPKLHGHLQRRPSRDLFDVIERNPRMPERTVRYIFLQILAAVSHLHAMGYVHRDIKDENVIIDDGLVVKLIDFGASRQVPAAEARTDWFDDFCGTWVYCPPELIGLAGKVVRGIGEEIVGSESGSGSDGEGEGEEDGDMEGGDEQGEERDGLEEGDTREPQARETPTSTAATTIAESTTTATATAIPSHLKSSSNSSTSTNSTTPSTRHRDKKHKHPITDDVSQAPGGPSYRYRGPAQDVFSLGVLLYILLEASPPYPLSSDRKERPWALAQWMDGAQNHSGRRRRRQVREPAGGWGRRSVECRDLVWRMLEADPERRIDVKGIAEHRWLATSVVE